MDDLPSKPKPRSADDIPSNKSPSSNANVLTTKKRTPISAASIYTTITAKTRLERFAPQKADANKDKQAKSNYLKYNKTITTRPKFDNMLNVDEQQGTKTAGLIQQLYTSREEAIAALDKMATEFDQTFADKFVYESDVLEMFEGAEYATDTLIWRIVNTTPVPLPAQMYGKFREGDCYIILSDHLTMDHSSSSGRAPHSQDMSTGGGKKASAGAKEIYFWIGKYASNIKAAVCVFLVMELHKKLLGDAIQYREEQGAESQKFKDLLKEKYGDISYLPGGDPTIPLKSVNKRFSFEKTLIQVRSRPRADNRKKPELEMPELYRQRVGREPRSNMHHIFVSRAHISKQSLNSDDVFVFEASATKIYVWYGKNANPFKRLKGYDIAVRMKYREKKTAKIPTIVTLEEGFSDDEAPTFWTELGNSTLIDEPVEDVDPVMYRVKVEDGKMAVDELQGPIVFNAPANKTLDPKGSYILYCRNEVYVWFGSKSESIERKYCTALAERIKEINTQPSVCTGVSKLFQGSESALFEEKFFNETGFHFADCPEKWEKRREEYEDVAKPWDMSAIIRDAESNDSETRQRNYAQTLSDKEKVIDAESLMDEGTGVVRVWRIIDSKLLRPIGGKEYGQFYAAECYIILYEEDVTQTVKGKSFNVLPKRICYYWIGAQCGESDLINDKRVYLNIWKENLVNIFKRSKNTPTYVDIPQFKETEHFLKLFNGKFVVHRGPKPDDGLKGSNIEDDTWHMYRIYQNGIENWRTRATEQQYAYESTLNSNDLFILMRAKKAFVWIGKKCAPERKKSWENFKDMILDGKDVEVVDEDFETRQFWEILYENQHFGREEYLARKDDPKFVAREEEKKMIYARNSYHFAYAKEKLFYDVSKMYKCSIQTGRFVVEQIPKYTQEDLDESDVVVLDCIWNVFVWIGVKANDTVIYLGKKVAEDIYKRLKESGDRPRTSKLTEVRSNGEIPLIFKAHFQAWTVKGEPKLDRYVKRWRAVVDNEKAIEKASEPIRDLISKYMPFFVTEDHTINVENAKTLYKILQKCTLKRQLEDVLENTVYKLGGTKFVFPPMFVEFLWNLKQELVTVELKPTHTCAINKTADPYGLVSLSDMIVQFGKKSRARRATGNEPVRGDPNIDFKMKAVKETAWTELRTVGLPPVARYWHASTLEANRGEASMWVFGGEANNCLLRNDLYSLDLSTLRWAATNNFYSRVWPSVRNGHTLVTAGNNLILIGGGEEGNEIYEFNIEKNFWSKYSGSDNDPASFSKPQPRKGHSCVFDHKKNRLIVFGGKAPGLKFLKEQRGNKAAFAMLANDHQHFLLNDLYQFNLETKKWEKIWRLGSTVPSQRYGHTAVLDYSSPKPRMIVFGGKSIEGVLENDVHSLCLESYAWTKLETTGDIPAGRERHTAVVNSGRMFVFGGWCKGGATNDVYELDLAKLVWRKLHMRGPDIPCRRYGHSAIFHRGKMFVFGGRDRLFRQLNDMYQCTFVEEENKFGEEEIRKEKTRVVQHQQNLMNEFLKAMAHKRIEADTNSSTSSSSAVEITVSSAEPSSRGGSNREVAGPDAEEVEDEDEDDNISVSSGSDAADDE
eukprot:GEZU01024624.1.p1 GENE.GEZU01024624.1~~GEZU01024624.1.p1  ORF type:complete len:1584 (-),score=534.11 GEZU01024624.1:56-4807(-)